MKILLCPVVLLGGLLIPVSGLSWTRARLTDVDVMLEVQSSGDSEFVTEARFEVEAGQFHGFDLAPQTNRTLLEEKCFARVEGGLKTHVKAKKLFDGRTRIVLANKESVKEGAVVFTLVHAVNLQKTGALRRYNSYARLDWTPIIWDHGTDSMSVSIKLPGSSQRMDFDNDVVRDYELETRTENMVRFRKFRTVKWYPMQVVVDFDAALVSLTQRTALAPADEAGGNAGQDHRDRIVSAGVMTEQPPPLYARLIPTFVALLGLLLMVLKARGIQNAYWDVGTVARFRLLRHTGFFQRFLLSAIAIAIGTVAQLAGSIAASIPALAVSAALWLMARTDGAIVPAAGGSWRPMTDNEMTTLKQVLTAYRRRRTSALDVSTLPGAVFFVVVVTALVIGGWAVRGVWPSVAFNIMIVSLIWILPVWFSFFRSELPVDPGIESFNMLNRWKRGLNRLVGRMVTDASAQFWIRENETGPLEVRLRVIPSPDGLNVLEIATEVVRAQSSHRIRKVAILKMSPGTEIARRLAACPNAVEHHLTPDLQQEIVVLRNRRGKRDAGFAPLRNALSIIRG
ncbi:MAG: hypothetical protein JXX14_22955 [Deltaproteobacteria bacterium]|nr:hypothetical protein [Deltaproteobacteria bacterium]